MEWVVGIMFSLFIGVLVYGGLDAVRHGHQINSLKSQ